MATIYRKYSHDGYKYDYMFIESNVPIEEVESLLKKLRIDRENKIREESGNLDDNNQMDFDPCWFCFTKDDLTKSEFRDRFCKNLDEDDYYQEDEYQEDPEARRFYEEALRNMERMDKRNGHYEEL